MRTHLARLAAVLLLSQLLGCGAEELSDFQRMKLTQDQAVDELKKMGGQLTSKSYQLGSGWAVSLPGATLTDKTFEHLKALERVAELDLSKSSITDAQVAQLVKSGTFLFKLDLSGTAVSDASLEPLGNLYLLLDLNLSGTKVTPAAVEQFKAKRKADTKVMEMFRGTKVKL